MKRLALSQRRLPCALVAAPAFAATTPTQPRRKPRPPRPPPQVTRATGLRELTEPTTLIWGAAPGLPGVPRGRGCLLGHRGHPADILKHRWSTTTTDETGVPKRQGSFVSPPFRIGRFIFRTVGTESTVTNGVVEQGPQEVRRVGNRADRPRRKQNSECAECHRRNRDIRCSHMCGSQIEVGLTGDQMLRDCGRRSHKSAVPR